MRKWFIFLIALILLFPTSVRAQEIVTLKSLNVQLWSEFDQPSMLTILEFEVADGIQLPITLDIPVPSGANITAVAFGPENSLLLANYSNKASDDPNWQVISIFVTDPTYYRVEYYMPLERSGNKRSFTFQWTGPYSVNEFNIDVRVPQDSTNVKTSPAIPFVQEQPFLSGGAMTSGLQEGQNYELQIEYSRESEEIVSPSSSPQAEPISPVDENTDGRATLNNLPVILGGFGVVLIIIALTFYLRGRSVTEQTSKPRKRSRSTQNSGTQTYCHECGARANEGDRFCRTCGSKLRAS